MDWPIGLRESLLATTNISRDNPWGAADVPSNQSIEVDRLKREGSIHGNLIARLTRTMMMQHQIRGGGHDSGA